MHVTTPSRASWVWEPGSAAAPANAVGWKPVQLVPENARAGRGGFPVPVGASQNQAFWIEIYTGRDRPAGTYQGRLTVTADGRRQELPLSLELFDFALPDENSHARDGVLRQRPARAVPRPQHGCGVSPLRPSPAHRAGARIRHPDRAGRTRAVHRRGLHARRALRGTRARVSATSSSPHPSTVRAASTTTARARGRMRMRG